MAISEAAMKRLKQSAFFHEVESVVRAWDYYIYSGNREKADEMMHKWSIAKLALKHITGNTYGFSRDGKTYSIVNENDCSDILIFENSAYRAE